MDVATKEMIIDYKNDLQFANIIDFVLKTCINLESLHIKIGLCFEINNNITEPIYLTENSNLINITISDNDYKLDYRHYEIFKILIDRNRKNLKSLALYNCDASLLTNCGVINMITSLTLSDCYNITK